MTAVFSTALDDAIATAKASILKSIDTQKQAALQDVETKYAGLVAQAEADLKAAVAKIAQPFAEGGLLQRAETAVVGEAKSVEERLVSLAKEVESDLGIKVEAPALVGPGIPAAEQPVAPSPAISIGIAPAATGTPTNPTF